MACRERGTPTDDTDACFALLLEVQLGRERLWKYHNWRGYRRASHDARGVDDGGGEDVASNVM
jgi:hypothetical protein